MSKIQKISIFAILISAIFGLVIVWTVFLSPLELSARASYVTIERVGNTASTTVVSMSPGTATTTLSFETNEVDEVNLFMQVNASSSTSTLAWEYEFSNDNVDWFGEDGIIITASLGSETTYHSSSTISHRWNPGAAGIARKTVKLPTISSRYSRIVFTVPDGVGNLTMWANASLKRNAGN